MKLPNALFASALVLAAAIVFAAAKPAISQGGAGYMIASSGASSSYVWRVNTSTGQVSYCIRTSKALDAGAIKKAPPFCSGQSQPAR